jgi:hypothetical protein
MITVKRKIQIGRGPRGARRFSTPRADVIPIEPGSIPRISRLMALAIRFERLLRDGRVADFSELARLGHVTQPRITQILNLTLLAADIQEALLFLPRVQSGRAPIHEHLVRPIAAEVDWARQRKMWTALIRDDRTVTRTSGPRS